MLPYTDPGSMDSYVLGENACQKVQPCGGWQGNCMSGKGAVCVYVCVSTCLSVGLFLSVCVCVFVCVHSDTQT